MGFVVPVVQHLELQRRVTRRLELIEVNALRLLAFGRHHDELFRPLAFPAAGVIAALRHALFSPPLSPAPWAAAADAPTAQAEPPRNAQGGSPSSAACRCAPDNRRGSSAPSHRPDSCPPATAHRGGKAPGLSASRRAW